MRRLVYNREMVRVRYEDCRLPVAAIISNLKKSYLVNRSITIEEEDDDLYFELIAMKYNDISSTSEWKTFMKLYNIKEIKHDSMNMSMKNGRSLTKILLSFKVINYKKINSNFIKSHKGIKRYSL